MILAVPAGHQDCRRRRPLVARLLLAAVAGFVGTKLMEPVAMKLYELESPDARAQEDRVRPGPPYRIAAEKTSKLVGLELGERQLDLAGMGFHYGLGVSWALVYPVLRRLGLGPIGAGFVTGASLSLIVDEGLTPALGFSAPNRAYPLVTHLRAFVAHLVYGLGVAAVVESAGFVLRRA